MATTNIGKRQGDDTRFRCRERRNDKQRWWRTEDGVLTAALILWTLVALGTLIIVAVVVGR